MKYTLSMIKPDATKRGVEEKVKDFLKNEDFNIIAEKRVRLTKKQAEHFYDIHKDKPFFKEMVSEMISGDVLVHLLHRDNAVEHHRKIIGHTNPDHAEENTIRKMFGVSLGQNTIHGSDSNENAEKEISFFFGLIEKITD